MICRPLTPDEDITRQIVDLFNTELGNETTNPQLLAARSVDGVVVFVVFQVNSDVEVAGACSGYVLDENDPDAPGGYIEYVAVKRGFRSRGRGRKLVERCMQELRTRGVDRFITDSWMHGDYRSRSAELFHDLGFRQVGDVEHDLYRGSHCPFCGPDCHCPGMKMVREPVKR